MNRLTLTSALVAMLLCSQYVFSGPVYNQTLTVTGSGYDMGHAVVYDNNGNLFYAGHTQGSGVDVNPTSGQDIRDTTNSSADALLTKINSDGSYAWSRMMGGNLFDRGSSLATDRDGNVYLAGNFQGTVDFNPDGSPDVHSSANGGTEYDNYLSKFDSDGSYEWTVVLGGYFYIYGKTIDVDQDGNVYVTGAFNIPQDFALDDDSDWRDPVGSDDIFLTKINHDGSHGWTYTMGDTGKDMGHSVVVDSNNNVYFTGHFQGTVDLDPTEEVSEFTSDSGSVDAYIIKFDSEGEYQYTKTWGGNGWDGTYNIETDASNNIYVSGLFSHTTDLDPGNNNDTHIAEGFYDLYVTKLDSDGDWVWSRTLGKSDFDFSLVDTGGAMTVDKNGNVYLGRCFSGSLDFNPDGGDLKGSRGGLDGFVTKFDTNGNYGWTHVMGGDSNDCVNALATNSSGDLLAAGNFQVSADFNPNGGGDEKTGNNGFDLFVSQFVVADDDDD